MAINELRTISVFVTTAELGSLRKAAVALGISPQAASQALAQLEQHLGVRLFHRTTRSMALTDEGQRFLDEARPSLTGLQRAVQAIRHAREDIAGPLRIVGPRATFAPLLWRLDYYGIDLSKNAAPLLKYAERIFSRPAYIEALTPSEKVMRK